MIKKHGFPFPPAHFSAAAKEAPPHFPLPPSRLPKAQEGSTLLRIPGEQGTYLNLPTPTFL